MVTLIYKDAFGRVCRKQCASVGSAFDLIGLLLPMQRSGLRKLTEMVNVVLALR